MLINGEKFACEACIRGHRVSSCHHSDRPLLHVNKKGRPVSQCQHCRGLRKSRSQHVHCECHQKGHTKEDCQQDKQDVKQEPGTCCCSHGTKCTCALKKEHPLESVPEDIPQLLQPKDSHKSRHAYTNSHDPKTTVFTNGHHKPVHKFNDSHNDCAPYKIPSKSNSLHGHRDIAQRSVDNLPLLNRVTRPFHESPLHNSMTPPKQTRMVKSEHNSPHLGPTILPTNDLTNDFTIPAFDPNAYSYSPFGSNASPAPPNNSQPDLVLPDQFPDSWFMTYEQAHDYEPPVDWSQYNFDSSENLSGNLTSGALRPGGQSSNFSSLEQYGHLNPGMTSSSGDVSEVEDLATARPSVPRSTSHDVSRGSPAGDDTPDHYRLSSASSYLGTPQVNLLATENLANLDIDDYLRQAEAETRKMQMQNQQMQMQQLQQSPVMPFVQHTPSPAPRLSTVSNVSSTISSPGRPNPGEHPYTIHEAQQFAHMNEVGKYQSPIQQETTPSSIADDPAWSVAPDMSNPALTLDDEREDEDWVR